MVRFSLVRMLFVVLQAVVFVPAAIGADSIEQCRKLYAGSETLSTYSACLPIAESGNGEASFVLSSLYTQGFGVDEPDLNQAMIWLNRSAEQGYGPACYNLATLYEQGEVVDLSYVSAFDWFKKGAELGHTQSQLKTGLQSLKGIGTQPDYGQALFWLDKAAVGGNANAQVTLAILLRVTDSDKSFYWLQQAAQQDNSYAHYQLADIYSYGKLKQPIDLQQALHHAATSVKLGRVSSQPLLDTIESRLAAIGESRIVTNSATEEATKKPLPKQNAVAEAAVSNSAEVIAENSPEPEDTIPEQSTVATAIIATSADIIAENSPEPETNGPEPEYTGPEQSDSTTASEQSSIQEENASKIAIVGGAEARIESGHDVSAAQDESEIRPVIQPSMLKDRDWLMAQPKKKFVLQMVQLSREDSVRSYLKKHKLEGKVNYYRAHTNAGLVYVVLYGQHFASLKQAKRAAEEQLTVKIQRGIWYRRYKALQDTYKAP